VAGWPWWGAGTLLALLGAAAVAWRLKVRLQGFTGDGLGATQQVAEVAFLLGLALCLGPAGAGWAGN
jgi:adenosylcobinamide-GDP ribazoletransferase